MDKDGEGKVTGKQNDTTYNEFVENLKKQYDTSAPSPIETAKTEDYDQIGQLVGEFVGYPYEIVAINTNCETFRLTPTEKRLNAIITKMMILYYLPLVDLGKLSLIAFVVFNLGIVATKVSVYRKQTKKEEQPAKKTEPEVHEPSQGKQIAQVEAGITSDKKQTSTVPKNPAKEGDQ